MAILRQISIRGNKLDPDLGADLELAPRARAVRFGADEEARRTPTEGMALEIAKRVANFNALQRWAPTRAPLPVT